MARVKVTLPDGTSFDVPGELTLAELLAPLDTEPDNPILAAVVNNEALDLSRRVRINATVEPVRLDCEAGIRCYRRSLCFLLALAWREVFPRHRLIIGHSLGDGYLFRLDDGPGIDPAGLAALAARMRELVAAGRPIERRLISYHDAREYFATAGMSETVALLDHRNESRIAVHACGDFLAISHGPLAPNTALLRHFDLAVLEPGFVLRYPNRRRPAAMGQYRHSPLLLSIYTEYKEWGRILGITSVGRLNQRVADGTVDEFVRVNEALQERKISQLADRIAERHATVRMVLVAGPSSSGKTTFTKKLSLHLQALGLEPTTVSVDDYFVSREMTPVDEHGKPDFESIHAIDVPLLNEHLVRLLGGEEVELPTFDFRTGSRRYDGRTLRLTDDGLLMMEGIHCLNDELTSRLKAAQKYKVYISALTQLSLDDHNRIPTTDNRLIRRMVRDYQFRGHTAASTLGMWASVRRGERRNIFPFQDTADAAFNSALDYELGVLKKHAEPLLKRVKPSDPSYDEAARLLAFLANFTDIPDKLVPDYSILREFIGDSAFRY